MILSSRKVSLGVAVSLAICVLLFSFLRQTAETSSYLPEIPTVKLKYAPRSRFNESKVALLIENRPLGTLAPIVVQMMAILPDDWRFRFMGSEEAVAKINNSAVIRRHVASGKMDVTYIPRGKTVGSQEETSMFLTDLSIIKDVLHPAEWLLLFQTDSTMCSKAPGTIDDWLEYSWVGAPWGGDSRYGGNGGLSLRRISSLVSVLEHQQRVNFSAPEDVWLTERLAFLPGVKTANSTEARRFSVEQIWWENPLGYHVGGSGKWLLPSVWGSPDRRDHIWKYCPEMKMILAMDTHASMPKVCNENW